ncbi:FG-GAP-like repeat-containing protein [bacterium]|jgi:enediyne biosynthesis protein E4|nr:FG-GAP-like repeat-containing protein [bacterium]
MDPIRRLIESCFLNAKMNPLIRGAGVAQFLVLVLVIEIVGLTGLVAQDVTRTRLTFSQDGKDGFTLLHPRETGVRFANRLNDRDAAMNQIRLNGSGVALGDVDGDGLIDIYLCRLNGSNALYKNLGEWKFQYVTKDSPVLCSDQHSTGATLADLDGDDDLDLLVNGIGTGTRMFENDGAGQFVEVLESGFLKTGGPTTTAIADVDGDGDLDVYVARYRTTTIRTTGFAILRVGEKKTILPQDKDHLEITPEGRVLEHGESDTLYLNDGEARFSAVPWTRGRFLDSDGKPLLRAPYDWGLAAMFRDIDQDGDPDLYVCNDFHSEDQIWINSGEGIFQQMSDYSLRHTSTFSMAVDFADVDRDGWDDFFVADMLSRRHERRMMQLAAMDPYLSEVGVFSDRPQFDRNTLQLNRGDGTYAEIADYIGLRESEWTWSASFLDVDLDGYEDLLCCTGHMFDTQDMDAERRIREKGPWPRHLIPSKLLMFPRMKQPKLAFRNGGDLSFEEIGPQWGFDQEGVAHGMAMGDLDNDGDLDVVVNNLNAAVGLYRNDSSKPRVLIRLKGKGSNTAGIGARVTLNSDGVSQSQEVISGGRYLSSDDPCRMFAFLGSPASTSIEVKWPGGEVSRVSNIQPNTRYDIAASGGLVIPSLDTKIEGAWYEEVSEVLSHVHVDAPFSDFDREALLPRKYSQMGPGVGWFDVDGDGWEDLLIGGGRGGHLSVYLCQSGRFTFSETWSQKGINRRDQTGIVGKTTSGGLRQILIGTSNFEDRSPQGASVVLKTETSESGIGKGKHSGPLALADVDGDGDLDLFIGAHCRAGLFPESDSSELWLADKGEFRLHAVNTSQLSGLTLVRSAVFADVGGDADQDLIVVSDWGGISLFVNESGRLVDRSSEFGLKNFSGWWNGVTVGDFNEDGRIDFVASNWGENHPAGRLSKDFEGDEIGDGGVTLFYGDFDQDGQIDLVEGYQVDAEGGFFPVRQFADLAQELSFIPSRFASLRDYNRANLETILGEGMQHASRRDVSWFSHCAFINRGDHFEALVLPPAAQFSPGFGIAVGDVDLDGHEDLFLAQNFFPVQPYATRLDAGRGLWLKGMGDGTFEPVSSKRSGITIYGEQRGAALGDFDQDGRIDLVVTQNGASTKLYRNQVDRLGMRIILVGNSRNPDAIGASVRVRYGVELGPAKAVVSGGGYWSQDSRVKIFPRDQASSVLVTWPDGETTDVPLPETGREVKISRDGSVQLVP